MENALNLDTVKLAENKKEIVMGSNRFAESKRCTGDWRYRRICLLCTCKSDRNRR